MFNIVLVEPEIPPNTGNVIRLAANTGAQLHLVEPLGFDMSDKQLRRAGLDCTGTSTASSARSSRRSTGSSPFPPTARGVSATSPVRRVTGSCSVARRAGSLRQSGSTSCRIGFCGCRCVQAIAASTCRTPSPSSSTRRGASWAMSGAARACQRLDRTCVTSRTVAIQALTGPRRGRCPPARGATSRSPRHAAGAARTETPAIVRRSAGPSRCDG
jgi:hypothetical protein